MKPNIHKRVLFIIPSLNSGGIQRYLLRFISKYNKSLDISIVCKNNRFGELENEYKLYLPKIYKMKLGYFNLVNYIQFYLFLKNNKYDTICDFTGNFAALPLAVAKIDRIKNRIAFYRGSSNRFDDTSLFKRIYNNFLLRLIPNVSTKVLSNSKAAFHYFFKNKWTNNKMFGIIYNGVNADNLQKSAGNLRRQLNIPNNAFVVGHTGRYDKSKNFDTLFKVAEKICESSANNYFIFCGRDTDTNLNKRINDKGLGQQIIALGYQQDIPRVLNTFDCFYFPSYTEGQPNSLLEALISNIPFVASNIEAIDEIIPQSLKSQLIDPSDYELAILKIFEIKGNPSEKKSILSEANFKEKFNDNLLFEQFFNEL